MRFLNVTGFCFFALYAFNAAAAVDIPLTLNMSEPVTVTGSPRVAVDVGGVTRYATYTSGSGTSTLTFTLSPQIGDVDLDGITIASPLDLNGGTLKDAAGNNATLTFTLPDTSNIKVNYPSLGMDFVADADGRYTLNGTVYNDLTAFLSAAGGSFTRASVGTYFDSTGVLQTATSGTPRFEYDPITHTPKGILLEESRTNISNYSSQLETATMLTATSVAPNVAMAPDGTLTADKITEDTSTGNHYFQKFPAYTNATAYQQSIFLKAGERSKVMVFAIGIGNTLGQQGYFDLSTGTMTAGTGSISPIGNGWYKITVALTTGSPSTSPGLRIAVRDNTGNSSYTGDGSSGVYAWGLQVEAGAFPTSYIPTTSAGVTRATDGLLIPTGGWYSATAGSVQVNYDTVFASSATFPTSTVFSLDNASINDRMTYFANIATISTPRFYLDNSVTGSQVHGFSGAALVQNTSRMAAYAFAQNYISFAENGTFKGVDTSSITLPTVTGLIVGGRRNATIKDNLSGHISKIKYYPARASDAQLALLAQ